MLFTKLNDVLHINMDQITLAELHFDKVVLELSDGSKLGYKAVDPEYKILRSKIINNIDG
jgi:transcriptional antiterminator Rof (Rho-off)